MAIKISVQELQLAMSSVNPPLVLDVRREPAFKEATDVMVNSTWHDPSQIDVWGPALDPKQRTVVYCVHGHEVSQMCADVLSGLGLDVRFLEGGFEGWKEAGGRSIPKAGGAT